MLTLLGGSGMKKATRIAWVFLALVGLVGCWPAPGSGPDRQAYNPFETTIGPDSVGALTELWTAELAVGADGVGPPIVGQSGLVHAMTSVGSYGIDRTTGARLWANEHDPGSDHVNDTYVVSAGDRRLYHSVEQATVGYRYQVRIDDRSGSAFQVPGDEGRIESVRGQRVLLVTYSSDSGSVPLTYYVKDLTDASRVAYGILAMSTNEVPTRLTLGADRIFQAGEGLMQPDSSARGNGVRAFPVTDPVTTCGFEHDDYRYTCPQWVAPLDGTSATSPVLAADQSTVFVGTDAGTVYAVDTSTGAVRWSAPVGSAVTQPPALGEGTLFVPTSSGSLVALPSDGCGAAVCTPLWSSAAGSEISVQPAATNGVVFVGTADGTVLGFAMAGCGAAACPPLWSSSTGSRITGAPAVTAGKLFVGTEDGRLIAFGPTA